MKCDQFFKNKMKNRRIQPEYLLSNIVDQDFQAMLLPLSIVQSCFLMPRFSIINNFITPDNHLSFYIKSTIGCVVFTLGHVFRYLYFHEVAKIKTGVVSYLLCFDLTFFSLMSIITFVVNTYQRGNVVELIIKLHHVLDLVKTDKRKFLYKHKIQNWLCVCLVVIIYIYIWLAACFGYSIFDLLLNLIMTIPLMVFDIQVVHVTRSVVLIKDELLAWINKVEEYKKIHIITDEEAVLNCDIFNSYSDIIKAFLLSNHVYQFSITFFGFQTFMHILMNAQIMLELDKASTAESNFQPTISKSFIAVWNLKNFMVLLTLSVACENFYRNVKLAESSCIQILSNVVPSGMRKACKNVLRLNRARLRKMSAFGVFDLDAAFPLRMLSAIVTYVVVILQFAFLS